MGREAAASTGTTLPSSPQEKVVLDEIERNVAEANQRFAQRGAGHAGSRVLGDEWLPDSEELTPTMKLKRRGILAKYGAEIEAMY